MCTDVHRKNAHRCVPEECPSENAQRNEIVFAIPYKSAIMENKRARWMAYVRITATGSSDDQHIIG